MGTEYSHIRAFNKLMSKFVRMRGSFLRKCRNWRFSCVCVCEAILESKAEESAARNARTLPAGRTTAHRPLSSIFGHLFGKKGRKDGANGTSETDGASLRNSLNDPYFHPCFRCHLEDSVPDLLNDLMFVIDAERFSRMDTVTLECAMQIYCTYLEPGAMREIKSCGRASRQILASLNTGATPAPDLFSPACDAVDAACNLLAAEVLHDFFQAYPRFLTMSLPSLGLYSTSQPVPISATLTADRDSRIRTRSPSVPPRHSTSETFSSRLSLNQNQNQNHNPSQSPILSSPPGTSVDSSLQIPVLGQVRYPSSESLNSDSGLGTTPLTSVAFGIKRGACTSANCDCLQYYGRATGGVCANCGHFPAAHQNLGRTSSSSLCGTTDSDSAVSPRRASPLGSGDWSALRPHSQSLPPSPLTPLPAIRGTTSSSPFMSPQQFSRTSPISPRQRLSGLSEQNEGRPTSVTSSQSLLVPVPTRDTGSTEPEAVTSAPDVACKEEPLPETGVFVSVPEKPKADLSVVEDAPSMASEEAAASEPAADKGSARSKPGGGDSGRSSRRHVRSASRASISTPSAGRHRSKDKDKEKEVAADRDTRQPERRDGAKGVDKSLPESSPAPPKSTSQAEAPSTASQEEQKSGSWIIQWDEIAVDTAPLGVGRFAKVYKGKWREQTVAVKVLKDRPDKRAMDDFRAEFKMLSSIRSPHVVYFFGIVTEPQVCLILEYCPCGSLFGYMQRSDAVLGWDHVFRFASDAMRGLQTLHSWVPQIVHRDLKSQNLLISENWRVKVCDFGLSRFKVESTSDSLQKVRGTYTYVSPEVYFGHEYTAASDIYAFGIILWELVARCMKGEYQRPYGQVQVQFDFQILIMSAKQGQRPVMPSNAPEEISSLIRACWNTVPATRPAASDVLTSLADCERNYMQKKKKWDKVRDKKERSRSSLRDPLKSW